MSFDTDILFAHVVTAFAFITPHNFELTFNNDTKGDADGDGDGHAFTCAPKNFLHWCLHSHARPVQKKSFVFVVLGMGISYSNVLRWYRLPYRCTVFRAHLWPSPFWIHFLYDELQGCLEDARRLRYRIVIRDGFTSQLGIGTTGALLQDLVNSSNLRVTNVTNMFMMIVMLQRLKSAWVPADKLVLPFAIVMFVWCLRARVPSETKILKTTVLDILLHLEILGMILWKYLMAPARRNVLDEFSLENLPTETEMEFVFHLRVVWTKIS